MNYNITIELLKIELFRYLRIDTERARANHGLGGLDKRSLIG